MYSLHSLSYIVDTCTMRPWQSWADPAGTGQDVAKCSASSCCMHLQTKACIMMPPYVNTSLGNNLNAWNDFCSCDKSKHRLHHTHYYSAHATLNTYLTSTSAMSQHSLVTALSEILWPWGEYAKSVVSLRVHNSARNLTATNDKSSSMQRSLVPGQKPWLAWWPACTCRHWS